MMVILIVASCSVNLKKSIQMGDYVIDDSADVIVFSHAGLELSSAVSPVLFIILWCFIILFYLLFYLLSYLLFYLFIHF